LATVRLSVVGEVASHLFSFLFGVTKEILFKLLSVEESSGNGNLF